MTSKLTQGLLLFTAYLVTARFALLVGPLSGGSALFWPPTGIAIAALLLFSLGLWPWIAAAAFASTLLYGGTAWIALGVAMGCTLEALAAAYLLRRLGFRNRMQRVRDVLLFASIAAGGSAGISALIGVSSYWLGGMFATKVVAQALIGWWLGDATSVILLAPILLVWSQPLSLPAARGRRLELAALLLAVVAASIYVFYQWLDVGWLPYRLIKPFAVAPLFIWAALRFGQYGTTAVVGLVAILAAFGLGNGGGPFVKATLETNLLYLQTLSCLAATLMMALAAAVCELQKSVIYLRIGRERARNAAKELRAMFDHLGAAHTVLDPVDGRFIRVNQRFCHMVGYTEEELLRDKFLTFTLPAERAGRAAEFQRLIRGEFAELCVQRRLPKKDGSLFWADISSTVLRDSAGRPLKAFSVLYDITARKEAEAQLVEAKNAAEAASRAKNEFLANVSHELKTPLGAMLGFSEFLLDPSQSAADRAFCVMTIKRNGELLNKLIGDVLDLANMEAGRLVIVRDWIALAMLADDLLTQYRYRAQDKGITLKVSSVGLVPARIVTDPLRLRQILQHLLDNAVKFSSGGEISVSLRFLTTLASQPAQLEIAVTDQGQGLSAEAGQRLFQQAFTQADSSPTRRFGGAGLGLYLAKKLAQALQGDLTLLASSPGVGSTFVLRIAVQAQDSWVTINLNPPLSAPSLITSPSLGGSPADNSQLLANRRILLVEDSPDNQVLISRILNRAGAFVELAANGAEGISKALAGTYDLVLMDIQMPVVDGYEATTVLRERGFTGPIVAITAHAMKDDEVRALSHGFNDFLSKPVQSELMVAKIAQRIARQAAPRGG